MNRYAFIQKPGNNAKYGKNPPREGYIHSWESDDPDVSYEEICWLEDDEKRKAIRDFINYMGYYPGRI